MRAPVDEGPTAIALTGTVTSLAEDADGGTNVLSLSGADAASFEVVGE